MGTLPEHKFHISSTTSLYKIVVIAFLLFAAFYAYSYLGISPLSVMIYALLLFLGVTLAYPLMKRNSCLYVLSQEGVTQNKVIFLPRKIKWEEVHSISYPSSSIMGGRDAVTLHTSYFKSFAISLTDIDKPLEFLEILNEYKSFNINRGETAEYLRKHFDREKIFYVTLLYILIAVSVLTMASFDMPYIWLEDNKYSELWAVLYFMHLFFTIFVAFIVYKDIHKRKALVKTAILLWVFVLIGPFIFEKNAYYNVKALMAEKRQDYISAENYITQAIAIHPQGYSYYETYGKALFHLGKYNKSMAQFDFLLNNDERLTDYYKAKYHLWIGKSLLKLDKKEDANKELQIVNDYDIKEFNEEIEALAKQLNRD